MRKFLLADPSIVNLGGHYLEYTTRVLKAAEQRGLHAHLAVNAAFDTTLGASLPWPVHRVFRFDIWGRDPSAGAGAIARPTTEDKKRLRRTISLGAYYLTLAENAAVSYEYSRWSGMPVYRLRRFERALHLRATLRRYEESNGLGAPDLGFALRYAERVQALHDVAGARGQGQAGSRTLLAKELSDLRRTSDAAENFANGLTRLSTEIDLEPDDVVFLPTASWADLAGLCSYLSRRDRENLPFFAPLLRRNIFEGPPDGYIWHSYAVHEFKRILSDIMERARPESMVICTDTEELAQQYRQITPEVVTMPVATPEIRSQKLRRSADAPATLGYIGDARREKGFQLLPTVLQNLFQYRIILEARLKAHAYTPKGPQDLSILRAIEQLRLSTPRHVELIEEALDSKAYLELLSSCDAVLVLYDQENYAARSSGVFVEALCAHRPVVVTAGTSMAALLDAVTHAYHHRQIGTEAIVAHQMLPDLDWYRFTSEGDLSVTLGGTSLPMGPAARLHTIVARPAEANYVWLTFSQKGTAKGLFTSVFVAQRQQGREIAGREYVLGCSDELTI